MNEGTWQQTNVTRCPCATHQTSRGFTVAREFSSGPPLSQRRRDRGPRFLTNRDARNLVGLLCTKAGLMPRDGPLGFVRNNTQKPGGVLPSDHSTCVGHDCVPWVETSRAPHAMRSARALMPLPTWRAAAARFFVTGHSSFDFCSVCLSPLSQARE